MSAPAVRPEFKSPDFVVFAGEPVRIPGVPEDHGIADAFRGLFARRISDVEDNWNKISGQIQRILAASQELGSDFALDEVNVQLGFSAEGELCFIAKAGVTASISATFKRRDGN